MVKMTLKNKTAAPMDLTIDDKPVTIAANGEYALSAAEGNQGPTARTRASKWTVDSRSCRHDLLVPLEFESQSWAQRRVQGSPRKAVVRELDVGWP